MRTLRSLLVLVLALLAATSVFYAFQQQKSLQAARDTVAALEKERNDLRKKLWDAEKRRGDLEAQLRGRPGTETAPGEPSSPEATAVDAAIRFAGAGDGSPFGRFMAAMDDPEIQRLLATQQRGALDARYAALFKSLNLTPAQLEQFKNLLVEKRTAVADVMAAARSQGLTGRENRDELRALVQNAQSEVDANIRTAIGDAAYAQYQSFEQTQPQRTVVGQLQQRLSYSGAPLTDAQGEQLVQVLAANADEASRTPRANPVRTPAGRIGFGGSGGAPITDQAIAQSAAVLNQSQVQALQQLQQEQQAQADLARLMRDQMRQGRGGNSGAPAQPPTPPKG